MLTEQPNADSTPWPRRPGKDAVRLMRNLIATGM